MIDEKRQNDALMRYSIIAPAVTHAIPTYQSRNEFFKEAAEKTYLDSEGKERKFSASTIQRWYYQYQKYGFDALKNLKRSDYGATRKLDDDVIEYIKALLDKFPRIPSTEIYQKMVSERIIKVGDVSITTINRCAKKIKEDSKTNNTIEIKRYERPHINEVWCGDTCIGPKIILDGVKTRIYIIALIDDASRFVVGARVYTHDNFISLMDILKSSVSKYGVPKMFNFDNGSSYKNKQMELLAARISSVVHFDHPNTPREKAKIERWFRTLRDKWLGITDLNEFLSLEEIQLNLNAFVLKYNQSIHSSLNGITPEQRFFSEPECIRRLTDNQIEESFLLEQECRVSKDCVIRLKSTEYEVNYKYAGLKILIRYSPDFKSVYVVEADGVLTPIKLLDKNANANIKRKQYLFIQEDK